MLTDAEQVIRHESITRKVFRDPHVSVLMRDRKSLSVTVVGAVKEPGTYELAAANNLKTGATLQVGQKLVSGAEAWLVADFFNTQISRTSFDDVCGRPVLVFRTTPEASWQSVLKQLIDLGGALVLLLIVAVPLALIALAIKFTSPGPIFFRQQRSGLNGRPFTIYKFRTMRRDADVFLNAVGGLSVINTMALSWQATQSGLFAPAGVAQSVRLRRAKGVGIEEPIGAPLVSRQLNTDSRYDIGAVRCAGVRAVEGEVHRIEGRSVLKRYDPAQFPTGKDPPCRRCLRQATNEARAEPATDVEE